MLPHATMSTFILYSLFTVILGQGGCGGVGYVIQVYPDCGIIWCGMTIIIANATAPLQYSHPTYQ